MGGYQIWFIEFPNKKERDKFEKLKKGKKLFEYNGKEIKESWCDCCYYMDYIGYAEAWEFLEDHKEIKIKSLKWVDLSTQGTWKKEK